jgi:hypothetical protein
MSARIWLKASATRSLVKIDKQKYGKDVYSLDEVEVETEDSSGKKYISVNADPLDPAASLPTVARKNIKRVSYTEKHFEGFRTDGIYHHKGAKARVETIEDSEGYGETRFNRRYQNISISAGSIKTLREIYTKVRSGELSPTEDWGCSLGEIERRKHEAEETKTARTEH